MKQHQPVPVKSCDINIHQKRETDEQSELKTLIWQEWLHEFTGSGKTSSSSSYSFPSLLCPPPPFLSAACQQHLTCQQGAESLQLSARRPVTKGDVCWDLSPTKGPAGHAGRCRCHILSTCGPLPDLRPPVMACRVLSYAERLAAGLV